MTTFTPGQRAVIDRTKIVTVERVTPTGRVTAGGRKFDSSGWESGNIPFRGRCRLYPLTPEIEAEMALIARGSRVHSEVSKASDALQIWLRNSISGHPVPSLADVEKAERIVATLREAMGVEE